MALRRNRNFLLLQTGWGISGLGTQLQSFALSLYILRVTGSAIQFAVTFCLQIVPTVLLAPFSGYLADRWDRRRQIVLFDLLSAVFTVLMLIAYRMAGSLSAAEIYAGVVLLAGLQSFVSATTSGLLQSAVPAEDVTAQQSVGSVVRSLTAVTGPALGGVLYGVSGLTAVFAVNALSFLVCAGLESRVRLPARSPQAKADFSGVHRFLASQREALAYIRRSPFLQSFLLLGAALNFIVPSTDVGLTTAAQNRFLISPAGMGAANAALAAGMGAGALLANAWVDRVERMGFGRMIRLAGVGVAAAFAGSGALLLWGDRLPLRPAFWLFVLLQAVMAGDCGFISVHISAAFQKKIDPQIIGRTSALTNAALVSAAPLGQVTAGMLLSAFPYAVMYFAESGLSAVTVFFSGRLGHGPSGSGIIEKGGGHPRPQPADGAETQDAPFYRREQHGQIDAQHGAGH